MAAISGFERHAGDIGTNPRDYRLNGLTRRQILSGSAVSGRSLDRQRSPGSDPSYSQFGGNSPKGSIQRAKNQGGD
jgi:hypothetical protein